MNKHAKRVIEQWLTDKKLTPDEPLESVMQRVADEYKTPSRIARKIDVYDNAVRKFYEIRKWRYDANQQAWIAPDTEIQKSAS